MQLKQIMSRNVVTVELDDKLALVKEIFDHGNFHHVLALEHGELLGVVSDRDLYKALSPNLGTATESYKDVATLNKKVHQIMSRKPVTLDESATIDDAIDVFTANNISCIPILAGGTRLVGIVTWRDLLRALRSGPVAVTG